MALRSFVLPPLDQIPDEADDAPKSESPLGDVGHLRLSEIIFGAGTFANQYNPDDVLESTMPFRTVRLALRCGIHTFDTSPFYGPSETILGNALHALNSQFTRSSYQLMTKCGRYGPSSFDYSPTRIRASIESSMSRLKTTYLDTVYLHDVEFVCTPVVVPRSEEERKKDALGVGVVVVPTGQEGKIWGEGDQIVLDAIIELRRLQDEGLVRNVGISGYPLPTLLRLALLVLHTPPFKPLDVVLSYCHLTLQNTTLEDYIPHFRNRAQVKQLVAASPLSMGLFTPSPPPWHPAPKELQNVIAGERERGDRWAGGLPDLALGYSIRKARGAGLPLAVGFSDTSEVHECMKVWTEVGESDDGKNRIKFEENVKARIRETGFLNWSWASPQKTS